MKKVLSFAALAALLAGCGADGEPVRPVASASVTATQDSIHTGATVGVVKGPVRIGLNL